MKKFAYHYNAMFSKNGEQYTNYGLIMRYRKIDSCEAYSELLDDLYEVLKEYGCTGKETISITSLSFLHEVEL